MTILDAVPEVQDSPPEVSFPRTKPPGITERLAVASARRPKRTLAIWGKHDPFFIPAGARAYCKDNPNAEVRFLDTGHFATETHVVEIAAAMKKFLAYALK